MPGFQRREENYSSAVGVIFLFNLIVGTGVLALPGALQKAGWVMGIILLFVLGLVSFITVTFIVESLAVSNAISRKHYGESNAPEQRHIEEAPLVPRNDGHENNIFEITEKYEVGQMGVLMSPKWCQIIIYIFLCLYLFGDLAIYAVVIGKTFSNVVCTYKLNGSTTTEDIFCWKNNGLTKLDVYRLTVSIFIFLIGPFVFFNLEKTKLLQILTGIMRWLAFFIMFVWSVEKLIVNGEKGDPPIADLSALPTLFGTLVYSFMCQHSIPGLLQPIKNKAFLKTIIGIDYSLVTIFYLILTLPAIFAFEKVYDLYTLNFWEESAKLNTATYVKFFAYYLALYPVFTLATNFPIIGITLKNNLRIMILKDTPFRWYYDKLLFPIVTILPPTILALTVSNLQLLVGIIGSYAGACVQYLIPSLLVFYARSQAKEFSAINIYASPFRSNFWIYTIHVWMFVSLVLITVNYSLNWKT